MYSISLSKNVPVIICLFTPVTSITRTSKSLNCQCTFWSLIALCLFPHLIIARLWLLNLNTTQDIACLTTHNMLGSRLISNKYLINCYLFKVSKFPTNPNIMISTGIPLFLFNLKIKNENVTTTDEIKMQVCRQWKQKHKTCFKCWTFYVPNLMQMNLNKPEHFNINLAFSARFNRALFYQ